MINQKNKQSVLSISIVVLLAISVTMFASMPDAEAKNNKTNGQPDLVATLIAEGTNEAKGHAWFWFDNDFDPTSLTYKIVLNKVDVGSLGSDGKGQDKNNGQGLEYFVEKLHIHAAPGGVHDPEHLLNVIGPNDDKDLKINGHVISGIWDDGDETPNHHNPDHSTKTLTSQIEDLCTGNTDVNIHLSEHDEFIRGIIDTNSDTCVNLGF